MGNCCMRESSSSAVWAGDDWDSVAPHHQEARKSRHDHKKMLFDGEEKEEEEHQHDHTTNTERWRLLGFGSSSGNYSLSSSSSGSSGSSSSREVKIKITRREMEELMARVDMQQQQQGLSMEQVLARLIINSSSDHGTAEMLEQHHRSWKPALQSIPEAD